MAGIPLGVVLAQTVNSRAQLKTQLEAYENAEVETKEVEVVLLSRNKKAGEEIKASDITRETILVETDQKLSVAQPEDVEGKRLKTDLPKGTMLQKAQLYEGDKLQTDQRYKDIEFVEMPEDLEVDDLVDIRIFFPSGEDYVVAGHKSIEHVWETEDGEKTGFRIQVDEDEILHLAAAYVDAYNYENTRIYAVKYLDATQESEVTYPLNQAVFDLLSWDPNVVDLHYDEKNADRRKQLEENLKKGESDNQETQTEELSQADSEELIELLE